MKSWEPEVGQQFSLLDSIHGSVLKLGPSEVTLGFVGTDSSHFAFWASRQRKKSGFFCSAEGPTPMLIMICRAGQILEVDEFTQLRIEQSDGSPLRLSLEEKQGTRRGRFSHSRQADGNGRSSPKRTMMTDTSNRNVRSDELKRRVVDVLKSRQIPGMDGVDVIIHDDTVVLRGRLTRHARYLAAEYCRHVDGVARVVCEVEGPATEPCHIKNSPLATDAGFDAQRDAQRDIAQ